MLEQTLLLCCQLDNGAMEQRRTWWGRGQGHAPTGAEQQAELPDLKAEFPAYAAVHSQVLQDVLTRLDRTYQAFLRWVAAGEQSSFRRFQPATHSHSFTYKQFGNVAKANNDCLVFSNFGRLAVVWSRPLAGTAKTVTVSHEAAGSYGSFSYSDLPTQPPPQPCTRRVYATGIDVRPREFLISAERDCQ